MIFNNGQQRPGNWAGTGKPRHLAFASFLRPRCVPSQSVVPSSTSKNGSSGALKLAGTIILIGGGPEDIVADGVAGVVLVSAYVYTSWTSNTKDNKSYPGPLTYTYRPPSQDPINSPLKNDPKNPPPNMSGWFKWLSVGGLVYKLYEKYSDFKESAKPAPKNTGPQFQPSINN